MSNKLTIQDIAKVMVERNGLSQADANRFASEMFALIQQRLETDQQVKVKGLGTFKIIGVEARESVSVRTGERVVINSHAKITFTPDAMMKELVNRPFSHFETVPLNDGVDFADMPGTTTEVADEEPAVPLVEEKVVVVEEQPVVVLEQQPFDDLSDDLTEEELAELALLEQADAQEAPSELSEPEPIETPLEVPADDSVDTTLTSETPAEDSEDVVLTSEVPAGDTVDATLTSEVLANDLADVALTSESPVNNTSELIEIASEPEVVEPEQEEEEEDMSYDEPEDEEKSSKGKWVLYVLLTLVLMGLSAYGGYWYRGYEQAQDVPFTEEKELADESVLPVEEPDTVQVEPADTVKEIAAEKPAPVEAKPQEVDFDEYAQKDARVRLGAYRIVGTDKEVKVQAGQTLKSIARAHLGPDMECYVEVYNNLPAGAAVEAGQVLKIPKLQLKKKAKRQE